MRGAELRKRVESEKTRRRRRNRVEERRGTGERCRSAVREAVESWGSEDRTNVR